MFNSSSEALQSSSRKGVVTLTPESEPLVLHSFISLQMQWQINLGCCLLDWFNTLVADMKLQSLSSVSSCVGNGWRCVLILYVEKKKQTSTGHVYWISFVRSRAKLMVFGPTLWQVVGCSSFVLYPYCVISLSCGMAMMDPTSLFILYTS